MVHAAAYSYDLAANGRGWCVKDLANLTEKNMTVAESTLQDLFATGPTGLDRNLTISVGNGRPSSTPGEQTRKPTNVATLEVHFVYL